MEQPLFSVLIANYNNGKYLQEAIDSVFAQTYSNWEVIIVDDCSNDNSQQIYEKYKNDKKFHIFFNEKNMGCGYTKRKCVEVANGTYCGFLDPDDVLLPNALLESERKLSSNPNASVCFSRLYFCNERLEVLNELRLLHLKKDESYLEHQDFRPESFASFRKSNYEQSEGINPTYFAGVDQDLYFQLEEHGDVVVLDSFTYKYRIHGDSVSRGKNAYRACFWNTIARYEACKRRGLPSDVFASGAIQYLQNQVEIQTVEIHRLHSTIAYKLGKFILKPFTILRKILS